MKTIYKTLLSVLALACSFASCENEIRLRPGDTNPLMVMNGLLNPDSVVSVNLSRSMSIIEPKDGCPRVEDAEVRLYVDGALHETLAYTTDGYYRSPSGFIPAPEQHIAITAANGTLPDIQAQTPIQPAIQIEKAWFSDVKKSIYYVTYGTDEHADTTHYSIHYDFNLNISFADPAAERNYYRLIMKKKNYYHGDSWTFEEIYYDLKDVFKPGNMDDLIESGDNAHFYNEFSDEPFDGKTFTLRIPMFYSGGYYLMSETPETDPEELPDELHIDLQSIPHDYYQYLRTRGMVDNASMLNDLFAEPTQLYNNIKGGIGILGSYSSSSHTMPLVFEP